MSEPTISGITIAAGAVTLTGSIFGMEWALLLVGLFGGMVALQHVGPLASRWALASSLASAAIFAALFAPVLFVTALEYAPFLGRVAAEPMRLACSFLLGISAQTVIPMFLRWLAAVKKPGVGQ